MTEQQMPEMPGFVYMGEIETPRGVFPHYKFREPTDRPVKWQSIADTVKRPLQSGFPSSATAAAATSRARCLRGNS